MNVEQSAAPEASGPPTAKGQPFVVNRATAQAAEAPQGPHQFDQHHHQGR